MPHVSTQTFEPIRPMDHGLQPWLFAELQAGWTQMANVRVQNLELQERLTQETEHSADLASQLEVEIAAHQGAAQQVLDLEANYNDLVRISIRNNIRNRALTSVHEQDLDTIERLQRLLELQRQENQGLARALRRANLQVQNDGWIAKKPKLE